MDEAKNQIKELEHKKAKQPIKNVKKKESKKMSGRISSLWDNFRRFNICLIGVPEGKEKEQEVGNLFEKTMKEKFPNLAKEIDMQLQEAQSSNKVGHKEDHTKTHQN